jgi:hypothetical protein
MTTQRCCLFPIVLPSFSPALPGVPKETHNKTRFPKTYSHMLSVLASFKFIEKNVDRKIACNVIKGFQKVVILKTEHNVCLEIQGSALLLVV